MTRCPRCGEQRAAAPPDGCRDPHCPVLEEDFAITAAEIIEYRSGIYRSIAKALLRAYPLRDPIPPAVLDIIRALELGALL